MEIAHILGYGPAMKYFCTKCQADVDFCPHKTSMELDQLRIKAEQYRKFAEYWEGQYFKLKDKVKHLADEEQEKK